LSSINMSIQRDYPVAGYNSASCADAGAVACSSLSSHSRAWVRFSPHISGDGRNPPQKAGRSGFPNTVQR
jgi:hypothetical protein